MYIIAYIWKFYHPVQLVEHLVPECPIENMCVCASSMDTTEVTTNMSQVVAHLNNSQNWMLGKKTDHMGLSENRVYSQL